MREEGPGRLVFVPQFVAIIIFIICVCMYGGSEELGNSALVPDV